MKSTLKLALLIAVLNQVAHAQAWSGVVAPARAIDWSHAGVPGGIPSASWTQCGPTIAAYGTAGSPASPATIQTAIGSCGANQYVQLGAGNFYLSGGFFWKGISGVVVRGMGANSTFIYFYGSTGVGGDNCQGLYASICFESSDQSGNMSPSNTANWTAGYTQGTTVITLSAVPNLKVGNIVILDELITATDTGAILENDSTTNGNPFVAPGSPGPYSYAGGGQVRPGRGLTHVYTVAGCDGSTTVGHSCVSTNVTIDPSLEENYWDSTLSPGAWWPTSPSRNDGVENLSFDDTNTGCGVGNSFGVAFWNTVNVWERGVRDINECRTHTMIQYSARVTMRDNYFFLARFSTSTSYGLECFGASDSLFENNILQAMAGPIVIQSGCIGHVLGYNFAINDYYSVAGYVLAMGNQHAIASDLNLWEGNIGPTIEADLSHGSHVLNTYFRNRLAGTEPVCWASGPSNGDYASYLASTWASCSNAIRALEVSGFGRLHNAIGNVMGTTGVTTNYQNAANAIWLIDTGQNTIPDNSDPPTLQTFYRWANCDSVHGFSAANCQFNSSEVPTSGTLAASQVTWAQSVPASHTLPASFYYSSKPSWWPSAKPWPIIGPDVTGGNIAGVGGLAYTNPAADCYFSLTGATSDGTGGPFPFDANTCYNSAPPANPPQPGNTPSQLFPMIAGKATGDHTTCPPCPSAQACECYATDGNWKAVNGSGYTLLAAQGPVGPQGATGATGLQGKAGAPGAVQSVTLNGVTKTGSNPTFTITGKANVN